MKHSDRRQRMLAAAVAALAGIATLAPAVHAQDTSDTGQRQGRREGRRAKQADAQQAATATRYPNATRKSPMSKAPAKAAKRLQALVDLFNGKKNVELRSAADEVLADAGASAYEKAFAAQLATQAAIGAQDYDAALKYIAVAVDSDTLNNDQHFGLLLQRAQLQMASQNYQAALDSATRFLDETRSNDPQALAVKGNSLYRLDRSAEAVDVLRAAAAAQPDRSDLQQLLADALLRSGKADEATRIAEAAAAGSPADAQAQHNLAQSYVQTKQYDKAVGVLEAMRKSGLLTEESEYRQLFSLYANMEGKEQQTIDVIDEGLSKGILKPDYNLYLALAQSYHFTDRMDRAIENYNKAGALAKDGAAYLNLAILLSNEQRIPEAKAAAQKALEKGLKNPEAAKKILALPGK